MEFLKNETEHVKWRKIFSGTIEENSSGIIDTIESTGWMKNLNPEKLIQNNQYQAISWDLQEPTATTKKKEFCLPTNRKINFQRGRNNSVDPRDISSVTMS